MKNRGPWFDFVSRLADEAERKKEERGKKNTIKFSLL
jgi:hypothetical protein